MAAVETTNFITIMFTQLIHLIKHQYNTIELMHWWSEGTSGIVLAFITAYFCLETPTYKRYYKLYATGALLLAIFE